VKSLRKSLRRNLTSDSFRRRFYEKVDKSPGQGPKGKCWTWTAYRNKAGYGVVGLPSGRTALAHRVAWFIRFGGWPNPCGLHRCDNPPCVRIGHIFEGDQLINMQDAKRKGRLLIRWGADNPNGKKTHCKYGHQFTPENTYRPPSGRNLRVCIACRVLRDAARYGNAIFPPVSVLNV
jgi:hypothetical protein